MKWKFGMIWKFFWNEKTFEFYFKFVKKKAITHSINEMNQSFSVIFTYNISAFLLYIQSYSIHLCSYVIIGYCTLIRKSINSPYKQKDSNQLIYAIERYNCTVYMYSIYTSNNISIYFY